MKILLFLFVFFLWIRLVSVIDVICSIMQVVFTCSEGQPRRSEHIKGCCDSILMSVVYLFGWVLLTELWSILETHLFCFSTCRKMLEVLVRCSHSFMMMISQVIKHDLTKMTLWNTVKAKVGKKVLSRVSNDIRSYVSRNRVSDGFLIR